MIKFLSKFHVQIHWYRFTRSNRFLLNPSQSPRKTLPPAPLSTSTIVLVCVFSPILNSIIEGRKYRASELLKAIFVTKKNKTRMQKSSAGNFLQYPIQMCRGVYIPYYKTNAPFSAAPSFSKNVLTLRSEPTRCPSELTLRIHTLIFL